MSKHINLICILILLIFWIKLTNPNLQLATGLMFPIRTNSTSNRFIHGCVQSRIKRSTAYAYDAHICVEPVLSGPTRYTSPSASTPVDVTTNSTDIDSIADVTGNDSRTTRWQVADRICARQYRTNCCKSLGKQKTKCRAQRKSTVLRRTMISKVLKFPETWDAEILHIKSKNVLFNSLICNWKPQIK